MELSDALAISAYLESRGYESFVKGTSVYVLDPVYRAMPGSSELVEAGFNEVRIMGMYHALRFVVERE